MTAKVNRDSQNDLSRLGGRTWSTSPAYAKQILRTAAFMFLVVTGVSGRAVFGQQEFVTDPSNNCASVDGVFANDQDRRDAIECAIRHAVPAEVFNGTLGINLTETGVYEYQLFGERNGQPFAFEGVVIPGTPPAFEPALPQILSGEQATIGYRFVVALDGSGFFDSNDGDIFLNSANVDLGGLTGAANEGNSALEALTGGFAEKNPPPLSISVSRKKIDSALRTRDRSGAAAETERLAADIVYRDATGNVIPAEEAFGTIVQWLDYQKVAPYSTTTTTHIKDISFDDGNGNPLSFVEVTEILMDRYGFTTEQVQDWLNRQMSYEEFMLAAGNPQADGKTTVTVTASVTVEISIPPFVRVSVTVTVSLTGPASQFAALSARVQAMAAAQAAQIAKTARDQAEKAFEAIKDIIKKTLEKLDEYRDILPWWAQYLLE